MDVFFTILIIVIVLITIGLWRYPGGDSTWANTDWGDRLKTIGWIVFFVLVSLVVFQSCPDTDYDPGADMWSRVEANPREVTT